MIRRPPRSTLFPYTTALPISSSLGISNPPGVIYILLLPALFSADPVWAAVQQGLFTTVAVLLAYFFVRRRSEEHTSELQSRLHLVCRLLLEKKKITDLRLYEL